MKRIVITNSALAYPPVPSDVLRHDDLVLPLVERFEEALFMAGPGYEQLRELFPGFTLNMRELSREVASIFPDWIGSEMQRWGCTPWEIFADRFVKFSLGPIMVNSLLARQAAEMMPVEVMAWEDSSDEGWWSGRQMVREVAQEIAARSGARLRARSPALRGTLREASLRLTPRMQASRYFRSPQHLKHKAPKGEVDILFVLAGPTLVPIFDRIGSQLQTRHDLRVIGIETPQGGPATTIAPGSLERASIYSFADRSLLRESALDARRAAREFARIASRIGEIPALAELSPPMARVLIRRLRATIIRDLSEASYHARLWQQALDRLQPRAVVGFDAYNEKLAPAVFGARSRGMPTIALQHGIWGPLFRASALLPFDEVLVFGDYAREVLEPLAAGHTRFTLTGHSLYDEAREPAGEAGLREELCGDYEHLVTVTTQPTELRLCASERRWWLRGMAEACDKLNARMVIKPHPQEAEALPRYRKLDMQYGAVRLVEHGQIALSSLIAASDLLVTRYSTTAIEAALLGVPAMTVNLSGGPDQYPFAEEGVAVGVSRYDDLLPALDALLHDAETRGRVLEAQQPFLDRHLGLRDGNATERIVERITALATPRR